MRRGALYNIAKKLGCNKISLGHHYDDVIETILMNMLNTGSFQTMLPKLHSDNFPGLELIRPLYLVREDDIISFAKYNDLSFINCACKFTENNKHDGKRYEVKMLIKELKKTNKLVEDNIFTALDNINLDCVIGYRKGDEKHSFLDNYEK
jgi:tRNA(Ile)-lysidine synthase TilS/MesJ